MPSPSHVGLAGPPSQHHHHNHHLPPNAHQHNHHHVDGFSPEDIHHLLGDVLGDDDDDDEDDGHSDPDNGGNQYSLHNIHHPSSGKRQRLMMEGDIAEGMGNPSDVSVKAVIRTERKRTREKQRRSDVNKQFQELTALLRRLETEDPDEFSNLPPYSPANRVELMGRTVQLITVLYDRSKKRKGEIADLQQRLEAAQKAGEETAAKLKEAMMAPQNVGQNKVMMMVPMLINTGVGPAGAPSTGDGSQQQQHAAASFSAASASSAAAMSYQPWMSSFMGMPADAQAMMGAAAMAASAQAAPHHPAMQMPFFMPMTAPMPPPATAMVTPPTTTTALPSAAAAPSPNATTMVQPAAPNANVAPSTSSGDLKQEAKVGSNLAHCA